MTIRDSETLDIQKQKCYTSSHTNTFLRKATVNTYHSITKEEKMGLLEFSWATITLIDIGVLSVSVLGLWWLKNQVERYKTLSEELEKRYNTLHREHETLQQENNALLLTYENLQQEFSNFQSAADQRYNALQQQQEILKEENQQEFNNFQSAADQQYNALQQEFSNFQSTSDRRYNTLQEESEERYNTLQEEWIGRYNTLKAEWEGRYNALQQQQEILKEENATLRAGLDALTREHKALQTAHDRLSGRHAELVERVMPVFEILAREKLMEINARNEN